MSSDLDVLPDPNEVATLLENLVRSDWPTSEGQRLGWFHHQGLEVRDSHREWGDNDSDSYTAKGSRRWGSPRVGWHMFDGEFVGVSWFLWHGAPPDDVRVAARQLRDRVSGFAGPPVEESAPGKDRDRFNACWEVDGRTIDMYLHGGPVLGGAFVEEPVVQLHVDHTARSLRADQRAAEAQEGGLSQGNP